MSGFLTWEALIAFLLGVLLSAAVKGAVARVKAKV